MGRAHLVNTIIDAHAHDPECGHRLIADEVRDARFVMSDRTVWKRAQTREGRLACPPVFDNQSPHQ